MTGKTNIKTGHSTEKQTSNIRQMKLKEVSRLPLVISQKRQRFTTVSGRERFAREREWGRARELEKRNQRVGKKKRFSNVQLNARYYFIITVTCLCFHVTNSLELVTYKKTRYYNVKIVTCVLSVTKL
jgi:hypothetical protein